MKKEISLLLEMIWSNNFKTACNNVNSDLNFYTTFNAHWIQFLIQLGSSFFSIVTTDL